MASTRKSNKTKTETKKRHTEQDRHRATPRSTESDSCEVQVAAAPAEEMKHLLEKTQADLSVAEEKLRCLRLERARAEKEMAASKQMLRMVLDTIPVRVFWKDRYSIFLGCNESFAKDAGLETAEDLIGKDDYRAAWRDEAERYRRDDQEIMASGTPRLNYEDIRTGPDGLPRFLRTNKIPLRDAKGRVVGVLGCYEDVTEGKEAIEALQDSEAKYRRLVEDINEILFATNELGKITYIGPAVELLTGYKAEDVVGHDFTEFIHPEDVERIRKRFYEVLTGRTHPGNYRLLTKSGGVRWVRTSSHPTFVEGKCIGLSGILTDISEHLALQEQLRQSQRLEAVGQLAGGIAHDFSNLLMVIITGAEFVRDQLRGESAAAQEMNQVLHTAQQAAKLISQLLTFSRRQVLRVQVLNLNQALADTREMLLRLIGEDVELQFRPDPSLGAVRVDPAQMQQVLVNLCVNAREAMPNGGRLTIETANAILTEADRHRFPETVDFVPGDYVRLRASDTGHGMPEDVRARIFEPFFTTKSPTSNSGLGLSTVYGIVRQHDGYIAVDSAPGQGAAFDVYLPRCSESPQERDQDAKPSALVKGDETILLVEDDADVLRVEVRILRQLGYEVIEATTAEEAIRLAEESGKRIRLLFTDVVMPGMDGPTLAQKLGTAYPDLKVILTSGYPEERVAQLGVPKDRTSFIQKPFSRHDVANRLRQLLDGTPPAP